MDSNLMTNKIRSSRKILEQEMVREYCVMLSQHEKKMWATEEDKIAELNPIESKTFWCYQFIVQNSRCQWNRMVFHFALARIICPFFVPSLLHVLLFNFFTSNFVSYIFFVLNFAFCSLSCIFFVNVKNLYI